MAIGAVLVELEQALHTEGVFSSQEANVFMQTRANRVRDFTLGLTAGATITWLASQRLPNLIRLNVTAGVSFFSGMLAF